jgi:ABC-type sugar transport system ATPase subunit
MSREKTERGPGGAPALDINEVSKSYGPVRALSGVSLKVHPGEVVALLGDNGAGKSTLVKIIAGSVIPDSGTISVDGKVADVRGPEDARRLGIETVYQNLALCDDLDVSANLFLNRELRAPGFAGKVLGWMDRAKMYRETMQILSHLKIDIKSPRQEVARLSGGQRQAIAVGKAVAWGQHIVLMDEPVAALGVKESRQVLALVDRLRSEGVAVLIISHNMEDVMDVCDRAVVLRQGRKVADVEIKSATRQDLVHYITTGEAPDVRPAKH